MSTVDQRPLNHRERGALGAEKRWGPRRIVRLDTLPPDEARIIRALIETAKSEKANPDGGQAA